MTGLPPTADFDPHYAPRSRAARKRLVLRGRVRTGLARVRTSWWPLLQASVAAMLAYWFSLQVLGHSNPMFAPIAAFIILGFTADRELRRMLEMGIGVSLGVGLGDLVVELIGSGVWQLGLVMFCAALLARFLDRGMLLTMQAGVQSLVIVALPAGYGGGPLGRWTDALAGVGFALLMALATPFDPRRRARIVAGESLHAISQIVHHCSLAVRFADAEEVKLALSIGRRSQTLLEDWQSVTRNATEFNRISPAAGRIGPELAVLSQAAERGEIALRNARALARRTYDVVLHHTTGPTLADYLDDLSAAATDLGLALARGGDPAPARARLEMVGARSDPYALGEGDWVLQALALMARPLVIDLLEAAGSDEVQSRAVLPEF